MYCRQRHLCITRQLSVVEKIADAQGGSLHENLEALQVGDGLEIAQVTQRPQKRGQFVLTGSANLLHDEARQ
jgi:hypothetical protein